MTYPLLNVALLVVSMKMSSCQAMTFAFSEDKAFDFLKSGFQDISDVLIPSSFFSFPRNSALLYCHITGDGKLSFLDGIISFKTTGKTRKVKI